MSKKTSAGLLVFRRQPELQVLLVHPGGPFWTARDAGAWTIPKGEIEAGEDPLVAAIREFTEETGFSVEGPFRPLVPVTQASGKVVHAWMVEGDCDPDRLSSNLLSLEWPRGSGRIQTFPEIDRCAWLTLADARPLINPAQADFLDQLSAALGSR